MSALEPDELTRLLTEAVEPVRPSPDAYRQIRAGIERRRRLRLPVFTLGGMVMAALIALAVVAIRPSPNNQTVEPAAPPVMPTNYTAPTQAGTVPSSGGSGRPGTGGGHGTGQGGGTAATPTPPRTRTTTPPVTPPASTATPSSPASASTGVGSPQLPTPVAKPAGVNDIDGDGRPDTVAADGTTLQVQFSRDSQVARVPLSGLTTPLNSAVVDIDADGFGELLVQTGVANGLKSYALLRYTSLDTLTAPALPSGLTLTAGVRNDTAYGFRCGPDHTLQINVGTSTDGSQFSVATTTLAFTPDGLTAQGTASSTARIPSDSSPFTVACGTLS
ncbi:conserved hypothetical protein [Frankia canadensis]|uniref:FG-GAP repeat protein n=1 Tax=Frankia canadensis TaxID=1836972 RepID=A0A2I2KK36_9ACTN|nr:VCBS repeat-containing protein [Frankia canadensis]SNQ46023.1 conserved hypothetical protein [Frankia canadensis]SOU53313.1 conserved hypothetical protein [Frankia canadensis]